MVNFKVGHEPIPPTPSRTFLGTKVLRLPSFFQYGKLNKTLLKLEGPCTALHHTLVADQRFCGSFFDTF